mmetsp:Transcript_23752/g.49329  ORF Transcript_23752/g.49329 Transcript_23752/m.49329 type:complete len:215 (-) Transcript_23752:20-664(-)
MWWWSSDFAPLHGECLLLAIFTGDQIVWVVHLLTLQALLKKLLHGWHDATLFGLLCSGHRKHQICKGLLANLDLPTLPTLNFLLQLACKDFPQQILVASTKFVKHETNRLGHILLLTGTIVCGKCLQDVPNVRMLVFCQCHFGELLLKQLHYFLSELKVLLVNFGCLGFQLQGEVIDAPYKGVSEEERLHETVHVAGVVGVLQSNTGLPVRHCF